MLSTRFSRVRCATTSLGDCSISWGWGEALIHVSPFSCFLFLPFEVDWILSRNLRTLYASACPTRSQPDSASRYPSCDTLICNSSNSVLGLPDTSLHLQIPSLFICKSNVGMTTLTYGGTMFSNIGWIGVSKRSEKSSRSHTVCSAIGGSASSEKSSRSLTLCWTIGGSVSNGHCLVWQVYCYSRLG